MKMGLSLVLVGHVNFLLGALVHGVVLRHVTLHRQARAMEYAVSNVVAIVAGLLVSLGALKGPSARLSGSALFPPVCVCRGWWWGSWPSSCPRTRGADVWWVSLASRG